MKLHAVRRVGIRQIQHRNLTVTKTEMSVQNLEFLTGMAGL